jgi:hypothetical protein
MLLFGFVDPSAAPGIVYTNPLLCDPRTCKVYVLDGNKVRIPTHAALSVHGLQSLARTAPDHIYIHGKLACGQNIRRFRGHPRDHEYDDSQPSQLIRILRVMVGETDRVYPEMPWYNQNELSKLLWIQEHKRE